ncbi:MAG TPA: L,D-transpeptidase [Thermoanaerobaculia bacterium]
MKRLISILVLITISCSRPVEKVTTKVKQFADDISTPMGKADDKAAREKERFDQQWRELQSFRAQQAEAQRQQQAAAAAAAQPPANFRFVTGVKEKLKGLTPDAINNAPVNVPINGDVSGPSVLRAQIYLDRIHYSVGAIDGRWGRNSAITVWFFQRARGMQATGDLDEQTFRRLAAEAAYAPVVVMHTLTPDDLKGPFQSIPESPYEKAKLNRLTYETVREKLAERFHCAEDLLELLNPGVNFSELNAGTINVPNVREPLTTDTHDVARIVISISGNALNGFDASGNLVFHAPTTVGAGYDPSPTENLHIVKIFPDPTFHYDPTLYHEVPDSEPDAHLPPGPNSPVGVVWMALSKEHYGIHGTPDPESIGYASSHGCIRLTNWDAEELEHRASEGTQVAFVDTRTKKD